MADPPTAGHNSDLSEEDLASIMEDTKAIIALEKERDDINADMNALRKKIRAKGIDLDAWKASLRRFRMDPDDRDNFDRSRELCDKALGIPVQADLFGEEEAPPPQSGKAPKLPTGAKPN